MHNSSLFSSPLGLLGLFVCTVAAAYFGATLVAAFLLLLFLLVLLLVLQHLLGIDEIFLCLQIIRPPYQGLCKCIYSLLPVLLLNRCISKIEEIIG